MSDVVFNTTGTYSYTAPTTGIYTIKAIGADGGDSFGDGLKGGNGATISASFSLTAGDELTLFVGDNGEDGMADSRSGGGGGGGTGVILNGRHVLIAAGGGGGASRGQAGFGGLANTNTAAAAGASPQGCGGGGFNYSAPNVLRDFSQRGFQATIEGGKQGTLIAIGASAVGFGETGYSQGGDGGKGFGGGGGANAQSAGGGGGYKGGDGAVNNMTGARGGDSFVNLAIANAAVISATAGADGGSATDLEGSVTITAPPPVAKLPSSSVHTQSAKMDWYLDSFLQVMGAINQQNRYRGEVRFNLASVPVGNVIKATLYLSTTSAGPSGDVIVERLTSDPSVAGKLYNATVGTEKATANIGAAGRYSWDVTAIVQQWRNQSAPNYGFRLRPSNDMNFPATVFNKDPYDVNTNPAGPLLEIVIG